MILAFAGLAIDARTALRGCVRRGSHERATAARWIAANAMAARGARIVVEGEPPEEASVLGLRAASFTSMLAALAAVPALVDTMALPAHWRLALRALGLPSLDRSPSEALAEGVCVLSPDGTAPCELAVDIAPHGYRVRVAAPSRVLPA
ncbi:MAG: hypothetical protein SFX73_09665 [Kofleriaceae bacterium]|nr:hypothetical protein [Kofleriaceae bacterium]